MLVLLPPIRKKGSNAFIGRMLSKMVMLNIMVLSLRKRMAGGKRGERERERRLRRERGEREGERKRED